MATKNSDVHNKDLHEVVQIILGNCRLQINGVDVAVPYLQGKPGAGKTETIRAAAIDLDWGLISTHFALKMLEELGGIPQFSNVVVDGEERIATEWSFPDIMSSMFLLSAQATVKEVGGVVIKNKHSGRIVKAHPKISKDEFLSEDSPYEINVKLEELIEVKGDGKRRGVIWLMDDMHLCGPTHMAMLYELLTERKLREYHLPHNVAIVLAGNTSQKAGAKTTFSAIVNRCAMFPIETSFDHWKNEFALPNNLHTAVVSFLTNGSYQKHFHQEEQVDAPWASPRSWTRFASMLKEMETVAGGKLSVDDLKYIATGHVGTAAASDFVQYYKIFTNFDMKKIFTDYKKFDAYVSKLDTAAQFALSYAIITEFMGQNEADRKKLDYYEKIAHMIIALNSDKVKASELGYTVLKELNSILRSNPTEFKNIMRSVVKLDQSAVTKIADQMNSFTK